MCWCKGLRNKFDLRLNVANVFTFNFNVCVTNAPGPAVSSVLKISWEYKNMWGDFHLVT